MNARRWLACLIALGLLAALLLAAPLAQAAPAQQDATPTLTPTPTSTPAYISSVTLDSGNTLVIERRWTFGELAIFLAVLANSALFGLWWIYEMARREVR